MTSTQPNLYVPAGQIEDLSTEINKSYDETHALILTTADALAKSYNSGQTKMMWTQTDLVALNVLLMNCCLRKSIAEKAAADMERWEHVIRDFPAQLQYLFTEKKYSLFQAHLLKLSKEDLHDKQHWTLFRSLVDKCLQWNQNNELVAKLTGDEEELCKSFMAVKSKLPGHIQSILSKRLELILNEMDKLN